MKCVSVSVSVRQKKKEERKELGVEKNSTAGHLAMCVSYQEQVSYEKNNTFFFLFTEYIMYLEEIHYIKIYYREGMNVCVHTCT